MKSNINDNWIEYILIIYNGIDLYILDLLHYIKNIHVIQFQKSNINSKKIVIICL